MALIKKRAHLASTVDWSRLLPELLELILDQLTHLTDNDRLTRLSNHLHFASVCSSWRSVAVDNRRHNSHLLQLPLLMLPSNDDTETRKFLSLSSGKNHGFHIPEIHRKWCCGSSQGWLITVDGSTGDIQLFNPFSRGHIQLPSLFTFSNPQHSYNLQHPRDSKYIVKAILSADPCRTANFVLVAIITGNLRLAYYKPGANKWITIETQLICFEDVIYYKGLFYAITNNGILVTYDFSSEPPIETKISSVQERCEMYYLVESLEGLLLVLRHFMWLDDVEDDRDFERPHCRTYNFQVHKLDESNKRRWSQMKSIGNQILFLGNSYSMSLFPAQYFPECKGYSIYFNDDYYRGSFEPPCGYGDIGVFNFENGSVEPFCESPPVWTSPTFWITPKEPW